MTQTHRLIFTTPTGAETFVRVIATPGDDPDRLARYAVLAASQAVGCPPSMLTVRPEFEYGFTLYYR